MNLHVANADGIDRRRLTNLEGLLGQPAWSPDGECIVFMRGTKGPPVFDVYSQMDLWRIKPDGTGLEQLTDSRFRNMEPAWSPDSGQIAFVSDQAAEDQSYQGSFRLYVMTADGTDQVMISDVEARDLHWSPVTKVLDAPSAP